LRGTLTGSKLEIVSGSGSIYRNAIAAVKAETVIELSSRFALVAASLKQ
jgi:hypothetical protein